MKLAIVGAGVSGLSAAHFLKDRYDITVFEREDSPGGLIKCKRIDGSLFHTCGGHVFNSKREDVLDWFWSKFNRDEDFELTTRNSVVYFPDGNKVPYPIENHVYQLEPNIQMSFINDLLNISCHIDNAANFEEFLKSRFGNTLYDLYFKPYNEKVWRKNLKDVPLSWLAGKLPMPSVQEMLFNNINHIEEKAFVHSMFWYEKKNGSQFIADRLAKDIEVKYKADVNNLKYENGKWVIMDSIFDKVIFCGNIKDLVSIIDGVDVSNYKTSVDALEYHGTTSVFCEIDSNPYSWIYQPSCAHQSHRIICTGNFNTSNDSPNLSKGRTTATVEFTDEIETGTILDDLKKMPFNPRYIHHNYNKYTYPIQSSTTREMIKEFKMFLFKYNLFFTGRFADWEYYNMDMAMGAAMDLSNTL